MSQILRFAIAFVLAFNLWGLAEYLLHRFAMHELHGRGIMSREHLEHHVGAGWDFSVMHLLSWAGMLLVGFAVWMPITWYFFGWETGLVVAIGWAAGYFFYEYQHAQAHLSAPRNRYGTWLRKHHFHHHFGHPMANHGVTIPWWDKVFGTLEVPEQVRVPRRMVQPWMADHNGELKAEFEADYVLVGSSDSNERLASLDRARAFASVAPSD
ncbi:MAG: sterol desaturase family protein [Acidimicrobiales bacterium]|nr:sterol desaturase family protein [Acidimicrobiales bacterium]